MIFIENIDFSNNRIRFDVRATSGIVPPTDCMDLEIISIIQARGITRVLAPQGVPTESDIDSMRTSQRLNSRIIE